MVTGLAVGLALVTFQETGRWASAEALWQSAAVAAPLAPRPLVNLAVAAMRRGDDEAAAGFLDRARPLIDRQPDFERAWSLDVWGANWAVLDLRAGRFESAQSRWRDAPMFSARWRVCRQVPDQCPLGP